MNTITVGPSEAEKRKSNLEIEPGIEPGDRTWRMNLENEPGDRTWRMNLENGSGERTWRTDLETGLEE